MSYSCGRAKAFNTSSGLREEVQFECQADGPRTEAEAGLELPPCVCEERTKQKGGSNQNRGGGGGGECLFLVSILGKRGYCLFSKKKFWVQTNSNLRKEMII